MAANFPGIYRGICFDVGDPENRMRIRVKVPQLLGDAPTGWAWPCLPAGWRNGLVKPHADHAFTDTDDGEFASGNKAVSLSHTNNHVLQHQTPQIGEGVWVMFEGGDSDHPVWIGTF